MLVEMRSQDGNGSQDGRYGYGIYYNPTNGLTLEISDGTPGWDRFNSWGESLVEGQWQHIALVWRAVDSEAELFVNAESQGVKTGAVKSIDYFSDHDLVVGATANIFGSNAIPVNGLIDEVRVWNKSRLQTEIDDSYLSELEGTEEGLVGYWNMNSSVTDISLSEADLEIINETIFSEDVPFSLNENTFTLITQIESPFPSEEETAGWADDIYANGSAAGPGSCGATIAQCGCALASMSMLAQSYGVTTAVDGSDVNPGNMNAWLESNDGYAPGGNIKWFKALDYLGEQVGSTIERSFTMIGHNVMSSTLLNEFLADEGPAISFSEAEGHYFLNREQLDEGEGYKVADPYWYNTKTTNDEVDESEFIQGYKNTIDKSNFFAFAEAAVSPRAIEITLESPAELLLTDSEGNRLGYDQETGDLFNEITSGSYDQSEGIYTLLDAAPDHLAKKMMVLNASADSYTLEVIGTGEGEYTLSIDTRDGDGGSYSEVFVVDTEVGQVDEYQVLFGEVPERTVGEILQDIRDEAQSLKKLQKRYITLKTKTIERLYDRDRIRLAKLFAYFLGRYANRLDSEEGDRIVELLEELKPLLK